MTIISQFSLLQRVNIKALDIKGRILKIQWDGIMVSYELEYWFEGNIKTVYLYEDELSNP